MDDYAGRVLADRYRLPLPPPDAYELVETRAFDTYSGQEVRIRQVPLPEVVDAELLDDQPYADQGRATRRPADPTVRRAVEAAQAAARIPDHPRLDQVFDVFAEAGSLWIVSEFVAAAPLSELLADGPLSPYRAAEIGADLLTALRALHAHGWTHRNVTARTVLVCDDGRVVLTGLAAGAAEEALCGYAPVPEADEFPYAAGPQAPEPYEGPDVHEAETYDAYDDDGEYGEYGSGHDGHPGHDGDSRSLAGGHEPEPYAPEPYAPDSRGSLLPRARGSEPYPDETYLEEAADDEAYLDGNHAEGREADEYGSYGEGPYGEGPYGDGRFEDGSDEDGRYEDGTDTPGVTGYGPHGGTPYGPGRAGRPELSVVPVVPVPAVPPAADPRAARAGAIAAYRAGARAAAAIGETGTLPAQRPAERPAEPAGPAGPAGPSGPGGPAGPTPPSGPPTPPEPQWWSRVGDDDDDGPDDDETGGTYGAPPGATPGGPPPRAYLTGSWSDGPHAARDGGRSVPAGGTAGTGGPVLPALPAGYRAAAPRPAPEPVPVPAAASGDAYRGPVTRLGAERARQTRIAVVGAVTERWAPEQAGPVHEHWRLAPPIGPATDLWALGALLYRAVQGHAPYPEDSAAELVQLVCAEPPAFAEECGPLRPVVESLLRQDPTERPDVEELSGWLRSLVRSAPEPEAGIGVVPLPSPDATRLPIVRRRGELVRRRRGGAGGGRHRHRHAKGRAARESAYAAHAEQPAAYQGHTAYPDDLAHEEIPQRAARVPRAPGRDGGSPRALGRTLLLLILLLLAGAVAYAVLFLPKAGEEKGGTGAPPAKSGAPAPSSAPAGTGGPSGGATTRPAPQQSRTTPPAVDPSAPSLLAGYELRRDPEGFQVGVPRGWRRSPINDAGQVRFTGGDFTLIVVPGRDTVQANGSDPLAYQRSKERELQPWRDSSWSGASDLRQVVIGQRTMAVGQFTWQDSTGREVFVRNLALIEGDRYHVVQVIGPENERDKVSQIYDQAVKAYRVTR
ncbi:protein kinase [Streptomyces sp. NPDC101115]|uniref:protein kinase n=1 Tax=Streptomyces sp. NPDC101115 TaxID=3366106 RepID=UPI00383005AB